MAGKFGAASTWGPLVDGYNLQSAKNKTMPMKIASILEKSTGLGDSWEESTPVGLKRAELSVTGGFYDTNTNAAHAALSASTPGTPQTAARTMAWGFSGQTIGEPFYGAQGIYEEAYNVQATVAELTKANADWKITGQIDRGQIVYALAAQTADGDTTATSVDYTADVQQRVIPITSATPANPCVVTTTVPHGLTSGQKVFIASNTFSGPAINGQQTATVISTTTFSVAVDTSGSSGAGTGGTLVQADSPNGAVGYLEVTAFSGFTQIVIKLRDSTDNVTFADLITFTTVTAIGAERATVSGTVDRYVAASWVKTGTGSATFMVGIART
jgi:hypothetical protein